MALTKKEIKKRVGAKRSEAKIENNEEPETRVRLRTALISFWILLSSFLSSTFSRPQGVGFAKEKVPPGQCFLMDLGFCPPLVFTLRNQDEKATRRYRNYEEEILDAGR